MEPSACGRLRVRHRRRPGARRLRLQQLGQLQRVGRLGLGRVEKPGAVKVALILKTFSNPYFVSMEKSAKQDAAAKGVSLTVSAGTTDGDTSSQITAIDNAIAAGDKGIVITPNGNAVNTALGKARTAGLYTIALDTAPTPPSTVNITYATDNTAAGKLDGEWAAAKLAGKPADIAMLDLFNNEVVSVDVDRDHGFLEGMGIPVGDPNINGKEPTSGNYTGGKGGTYKIACQLPTQGAIPTGKSAMQTCLQKDPNINLVYAINEPAAEGAAGAIKGAGSKAIVVAIDGGCSNLPFVVRRRDRGDRRSVPWQDGLGRRRRDLQPGDQEGASGHLAGAWLLQHGHQALHRRPADGRAEHHLHPGQVDLLGLAPPAR